MANQRNVYQQKFTISIPRDGLINRVIDNDELTKNDLRVFLSLLTQLNGWTQGDTSQDDPMNFQKIDEKKIARNLGLSKKKVEKSLDNLLDYNIIEEGSGKSIRHGYRICI